jgi:thiol-disulfide isomerase/thioredoxin
MKSPVLFFVNLSMIFIYINVSSCTETNSKNVTNKLETEDSTKNTREEIVHIQFIDKPEFNGNLKTKTRETGRIEYLVFYDDLEPDIIPFDDIAVKKMATYSTYSNRVTIRRYLGYFEFQDFLVHKGDSLIMSFDKNKPVVIKHSSYSYAPQDFNIENSLNKKLAESYLTTGNADDTRMVAFKYFYDDLQESKNQLARKGYEKGLYLENLENRMGKMLIPSMEILNNNTQQFLDSLNKNQLISNEVYTFYQQKYSNLLLKLKIMSGSIDSTVALSEINERFEKQNFHNEYFNQCLDNLEKKYFTTKAKWTTSEYLNLRDLKESFTFVKNSTLLSPKLKERMLYISLNKVDRFFHDDVDKYFKSFTESVTDKNLIKKAQAKYQKDIFSFKKPSNLHLFTLDKKQTTIEDILQKKKGKVLFIDFWASWCGPCIEEMKYSKSLIESYKGKNLEIMFLSMDDNYQKWNKASERLEINNMEDSFQILNLENSKFIKEHKLKTIPRYMIIDKNGVIINQDAPRPSDLKIRQIFDDLLKKK